MEMIRLFSFDLPENLSSGLNLQRAINKAMPEEFVAPVK
uniref:Uncharacterized protein n=1 Tax=Romanomermis culicivorax TaxID=13658 RepID=A0A915KE10_ROMCU